MRVAIYTCVTGDYDPIRRPRHVDPGFDYYCFTDNPKKVSPPWRYQQIDLTSLDPKDQNRYIKMLPHKLEVLAPYNLTLYLDGSIEIVGDLRALIDHAMGRGGNMFLYEHPSRRCIYAEAAACSHYAHDWVWFIARQMRRYSNEGYPANNGLFEANVIIRRPTPEISDLMDAWWTEYMNGAKRDQLSLPYVAWKHSINIVSLGQSDPRFGGRYFLLNNHKKRFSAISIMRKYVNRGIGRLIPNDVLYDPGPKSK